MKVNIERITPAKAKEYLKKSDNVRRPNRRKVKKMAHDMRTQHWEDNGESIKFHTKGLVDGQNRLLAVIESGTTQPFVVVKGVAGDQYIDIGERRTLAQILKHDGWAYSSCIAATVGNILTAKHYMSNPEVATRPDVSQTERIECFLEYQNKLKKLVPLGWNQKGLLWKATIIAVAALGSTTRSYSAAKDDFIYFLGTGEEMPKTDPCWLLREVQYQDHRRKGQRLEQRHRLAITIKAWNAHRNERLLSELRFRSAGPTAEKFPKIV